MIGTKTISKFVNAKTGGTVGSILGFLGASDGVSGIMDSITRLASGQFHAPDITDINRWGITGQGIGIALGGTALSMIGGGIHPMINKVGKFMGALGGGMIAGGVVGGLLYGMTHSGNPQGTPSTGAYYSGINAKHIPAIPPPNPYTRHNPTSGYTQHNIPPTGTPNLATPMPPVRR